MARSDLHVGRSQRLERSGDRRRRAQVRRGTHSSPDRGFSGQVAVGLAAEGQDLRAVRAYRPPWLGR